MRLPPLRNRTIVEALEHRRLLSGQVPFDPGSAGLVAASRHRTIDTRSLAALSRGPLGPGDVHSTDDLSIPATIEGVSFETEGDLNGSPGFGTIPPSPAAAVGPFHVVSAVNSAIRFNHKSGTQTFQSNLFAFFGFQAFSGMYDVRIAFDDYTGRWFVAAVDQTDASSSPFGNRSSIFLAVSDDADPNGEWAIYSINSRLTISSQQRYAESLQMAISQGEIYFTANMLSFGATPTYAGSRLWIVDKNELLANDNLSFTLHNPFASAGVTQNLAGLSPVNMLGGGAGTTGTFLINAGGFSDGSGDRLAVIRVSNPLSPTPTFTNTFVSMGGDVDAQATPIPPAPQSGTSVTIVTGDRRVGTAGTWRGGEMVFANTIVPTTGPDAGQATVRWYRVSAPAAIVAPSLIEADNVGGEGIATGAHTFYPAATLDHNGNIGIGFGVSAPTIFPSAAYVTRSGVTTSSATVYAAGGDFYVRTYVLPSGVSANNLWGNYSSAAVDPLDGRIWFYNQYAGPRGGLFQSEDGRWRTRLANVDLPGAAPPPGIPDLAASSDLGLSNTDNLTSDNTPTFTGYGEPGVTVTLRAGVTPVGSGVVDANGNWSITTGVLVDGPHTIAAIATKAGFGDSAPSGSIVVLIDTVAPAVTSFAFDFETTHSLALVFSEDVGHSLAEADLAIINVTMSQTIASNTTLLSYTDPTATVTFPGQPGPPAGILADGNYTVSIAPAGVTDRAGNPLVAFDDAFFVFAGDATRDRSINISDFSILASRFNLPGTFSQGDFNYNGTAEIGDFSILASKFNTTLPAARGMFAGGSGSDVARAGTLRGDGRSFGTVRDPIRGRVADEIL